MPPRESGTRIWLYLVWAALAIGLLWLHSRRGFVNPLEPRKTYPPGFLTERSADAVLGSLEPSVILEKPNEGTGDARKDHEGGKDRVSDALKVETGHDDSSQPVVKAQFPLNKSHAEFLVKSGEADYCYIHRKGVLPVGWLTVSTENGFAGYFCSPVSF
jgi:hypothetical protein